MRRAGIKGVSHRRKRGHCPDTAMQDDPVRSRVTAYGQDRAWFTNMAQHWAAFGWIHCRPFIQTESRRVVVWAIADHVRSELVVDALEMAR